MNDFDGNVALVTGGVSIDGIELMRLDASSEKAWHSAVAQVCERHGSLDILVNSPGIQGNVVAGALEHCSVVDGGSHLLR